MSIVVAVLVRRIKDRIYAESGKINLRLNDKIIVETEHGVEYGIVYEIVKDFVKGKESVGKILRKVTEEDKKRLVDNQKKSSRAQATVSQKVREHKLDMKLTCVSYTFDRSKLFIYYTSESRVDFRDLIKDLGHVLKTRIQMVQIGVRDESKIIGGIGTCGQVLCCKNFLKDFNSVTIDMVKEQELSLNTTKLSGLCGRLMCCIAYENDTYKNIKQFLPELGSNILTPEGKGKLVAIDCVRERVSVDLGDKFFKIFTIRQIEDVNGGSSK
ncbi:MAG: stage 0 sporulation protein [Endomicrobium sp.]|jgi:cell fate regulator YaaT (PSP1 superfamily)|uniref:PSP1 domain-containing protein n=1 Tax=Candidatus Endomicrobiellum cubanum TaxID=3242325 RepID=UPI00281A3379|nr:stage 0 sporulation protein [Endomicrobium sp.]